MAEPCKEIQYQDIPVGYQCDRPAGHPGGHTAPTQPSVQGAGVIAPRIFWDTETEGGRELPKCSKCGREIVWIETEQREDKPAARAPVDPAMVSIITDEGKTVRGHISHFATCPNAAEFRRGGH